MQQESPILSRNAKIAIVATAILLVLLFVLREVVTPVAIAFLLAYFFDPLVDRFEARKINRSLAILIIFATLVILLIVFSQFETTRPLAILLSQRGEISPVRNQS